MTKPALEQLQAMPDQELINTLCEAMGWYTSNLGKTFSDGWDTEPVMFWHTNEALNTGYSCQAPNESFDEAFDDYNPLDDTEAGRSQAFELSDKYGLVLDFRDREVVDRSARHIVTFKEVGSSGKAIVIASILATYKEGE